MYERFASVYDTLMDDFDYPAWADYYISILNASGCRPKRILECGCGTGSMSIEFSGMGINVTGTDISEDMLEQAGIKAHETGEHIVFARQDMRELSVPRRVDAVVCACDGVNYLTSAGDVQAFLKCAYGALKPGGALAFDVSTGAKLLKMPGNVYAEDRDDVTWLWFSESGPDRCVDMDLTFFIRSADGRYERVDEHQTQRAHTPEELTAWMTEAGFEDIRLYGDRTTEPPRSDENRIHIVGVRRD